MSYTSTCPITYFIPMDIEPVEVDGPSIAIVLEFVLSDTGDTDSINLAI
jgi:hypothetical protein